MKTARDIRKALRSRINRELKKSYVKYLSKRPVNCTYNKQVPVGDAGALLGVCIKQSRWLEGQEDVGLWICDSVADAKHCSLFFCQYTKEQLKDAFEVEVLKNSEKRAHYYKDLDVLLWILDEKAEDDRNCWWQNGICGRLAQFLRGRKKPLLAADPSGNLSFADMIQESVDEPERGVQDDCDNGRDKVDHQGNGGDRRDSREFSE